MHGSWNCCFLLWLCSWVVVVIVIVSGVVMVEIGELVLETQLGRSRTIESQIVFLSCIFCFFVQQAFEFLHCMWTVGKAPYTPCEDVILGGFVESPLVCNRLYGLWGAPIAGQWGRLIAMISRVDVGVCRAVEHRHRLWLLWKSYWLRRRRRKCLTRFWVLIKLRENILEQ